MQDKELKKEDFKRDTKSKEGFIKPLKELIEKKKEPKRGKSTK